MIDPTWTPDEALRILRDALNACIDGKITPTHLHAWLITTYVTPPGTPPDHLAFGLWKQAVVNVAVYLQCDFERHELTESLRLIMGEKVAVFTPITRSPCFMTMMKEGTAPRPLIASSSEEDYRRRRLELDGFREI